MMNFGGVNGSVLAVVLDGGDLTTTLKMSTTQSDFDTSNGNVFSLSGVALTAPASTLNSIANINTFVTAAAVKFPSLSSDPAVSNGSIYYQTTGNKFRACVNGGWQTIVTSPIL